jgi:hypothetical protein
MKHAKEKTFLIFTPKYAENYSGLKVFAIYPDAWGEGIKKFKGKHNWGQPPCLGYVKETDEYWASIAAFTAGLVHRNDTFSPRAVEIKTKLPDIITEHPIQRKSNGFQRRIPRK